MHSSPIMLMFTRRLGERIIIGGCIEVRVTEIHRSTVRLAISAPMHHSVLRGEMYEAIAKANREAANVDIDEAAIIADGKRSIP